MRSPEPDYRAFLRDLQKLCKKHGVQFSATDEGTVGVGPWGLKTMGEYVFTHLRVNPKGAWLGAENEEGNVHFDK